MRDPEFGAVRLRGFGSYAFRVQDPALFLKEIFGTQSSFTADQIGGYLKSLIVSGLSDLIGEARIPIMDLALHYDELSSSAQAKLEPVFNGMGLSLSGFFIENISLPEEVEKMIDRKSSMNIAGNLDQYMKFQAAEALRDAANNPEGGAAGTGVGLGAGMAMGQIFGQAMNQAAANPAPTPAAPATPAPAATESTQPCSSCGHGLKPNEKFCPECGTPRPEKKFCSECGGTLEPGMKFCPSCGNKA
jgi:membrane protease subunit (stomatin/prohibitin family)